MNQYTRIKVREIIKHNDSVITLVLDEKIDYKPGQFVMLWIPGIGEKPFSLSSENTITLRKVGELTTHIFTSQPEYIYIRGPYGNFFPEKEGVAIGGGCGIAPLYGLLHRRNFPIKKFVLACKTKEDLLFLDEIKEKCKETIAVTDNGSYGTKGRVTDIEIPKAKNYFICGPEKMMKAVAEKLVSEGVKPENIYLSMERYMKCAVGICGNCSFSGYRVCADGPVFSYDKIKDLPHFAAFHRTRTGELVKF